MGCALLARSGQEAHTGTLAHDEQTYYNDMKKPQLEMIGSVDVDSVWVSIPNQY